MKSKFKMYLNIIQEAIERSSFDSKDREDVTGLNIPAEKVNKFLDDVKNNIFDMSGSAVKEITSKIVEIVNRYSDKKITSTYISSSGLDSSIMNIIQDRYDILEKKYFKDYIDKENIKTKEKEINKKASGKMREYTAINNSVKMTRVEAIKIKKELNKDTMNLKELQSEKERITNSIQSAKDRLKELNDNPLIAGSVAIAEEEKEELKSYLSEIRSTMDTINAKISVKEDSITEKSKIAQDKTQKFTNAKQGRMEAFKDVKKEAFKIELSKILTSLSKSYYLLNVTYKKDMQRLSVNASETQEQDIVDKYEIKKKVKIKQLIGLVEEIQSVIDSKVKELNIKNKEADIAVIKKQLQLYFLDDTITYVKANIPSRSKPPKHVPERNGNDDSGDQYVKDWGFFQKKFEHDFLAMTDGKNNIGNILYSKLPYEINKAILETLKNKI